MPLLLVVVVIANVVWKDPRTGTSAEHFYSHYQHSRSFRPTTKHDHVPAARFRLILTSSTASMTALPLLERLQVRESVTITRRNSKTHLLAGWVISTRFSRVTELSPVDSPSFSLSEPS